MMKKFIALLLAFALIVTLVPCNTITAQAADTGSADIEALIETQVREHLSTYVLGDNAVYDGVMQLLDHARYKKGADLTLNADDPFTIMMMNSALCEDLLIHTSKAAVENLLQSFKNTLYLRGSSSWYDNKISYTMYEYDDNNNGDYGDDTQLSSISKSDSTLIDSTNEYDDGMIIVVGGATVRMTFQQTSATAEEFTYKVTYQILDNFDFNGNYSLNVNNLLSIALTLFGQWLDKGLIDTYKWSFSSEFELTFPNTCTHQTADYRWEFDGTDLISSSADNIKENTLEKIQAEKSDGTLYDPYYKTDHVVRLLHNLPWTVEFRMLGSSGGLYLGPSTSYTSGLPYLLKTSRTMVGGESFKYTEIDSETGEEKTKYGRNQYGIDFYEEAGYASSKWHTYRLENRIAEDGSNMVYLLIDGEDLGALDTFFINKNGINVDQGTVPDWFNGKDIYINYIFGSNFRFTSALSMEYIQIWENGESADAHSYYETVITDPTCTEQGTTSHICEICHTGYVTEYREAPGHTEKVLTGYEATYTKTGLTDGAICTVCNEILVEQQDITKLSNPFADVAESTYYYDSVLWALDNEITTGTTDTTFSPLNACTRAQVVTFLWRANGSPIVETENPFTDVNPNAFYYHAMLWAVKNGITNGTSTTTFSPANTCTRGQIVTFLWRTNNSPVIESENPFADVKESTFYYDAVLWAVENKITNGTSATTFSPANDCKRAEVVTFLYRVMQ